MALANGLGGHLLQGLAPSLLRSSFSTVQVTLLVVMVIDHDQFDDKDYKRADWLGKFPTQK